MTFLKAISVKQPWANMIASGEKTIETRTWGTQFRGDLLICSSKKPAIWPAGSVLALVRLVDCLPMEKHHEEAACCSTYPGAYAWILDEIRMVEILPIRGKSGVFVTKLEMGNLDF